MNKQLGQGAEAYTQIALHHLSPILSDHRDTLGYKSVSPARQKCGEKNQNASPDRPKYKTPLAVPKSGSCRLMCLGRNDQLNLDPRWHQTIASAGATSVTRSNDYFIFYNDCKFLESYEKTYVAILSASLCVAVLSRVARACHMSGLHPGYRAESWRKASNALASFRLFPRGSEFGPNLEILAGPAIQLRPGPDKLTEAESDACIFKININVDSPSQTTLMKCALMG